MYPSPNGIKKLTVISVWKSPNYTENAAYWIGATDMNNEGFFKWTDSSPFTYSSKFRWTRTNNTHNTMLRVVDIVWNVHNILCVRLSFRRRLVSRAHTPIVQQRSKFKTAERRRAESPRLCRAETSVQTPKSAAQIF